MDQGPDSLSLQELVAILLGQGNQKQSLWDLPFELCRKINSLEEINLAGLLAVPGVGLASASRFLAACEIGKRLQFLRKFNKPTSIQKSEDIWNWMKPYYHLETKEKFYVIAVDVKNRPILTEKISQGSAEKVIFLLKEAFCSAVQIQASGLVFVHNHPSGDPSPSQSDRNLTKQLILGCDILGLRFLDHVIVAGDQYFSFADNSLGA